jgi:glutamate-1-semialdehyde 2,1-aminomutase
MLPWSCRAFLVRAGSGVATFNIQTVPGVTASISKDTLTAPYNDVTAVEKLINTKIKMR